MDEKKSLELIVRRVTTSDRPMLRKWLKDPVIRNAIEDETLVASRIPETIKLIESGDPFRDGRLGIVLQRGTQIVGLIHFVWINWISRNAEVTVFVGPRELRRAMTASKVLEKVGHTAFRALNLHKIYAFVYGNNIEALSLFRRLMKEEACFKKYFRTNKRYMNVHMFGLMSSEYFQMISSKYSQLMKKWGYRF